MDRFSADILVKGIVQGVGFRPFLHREMDKLALSGWIRNTSDGVEIHAEGAANSLDALEHALRNNVPALAYIESIHVEKNDKFETLQGIHILSSRTLDQRNTLISPDVATCPDCLKELFDPADRRYRYPFINCTNCGPRFSIIKDLPYDRASTTMAPFAMCPQCSAEYGNISNRRYHAQPDCCSQCGPELFYLDKDACPVDGDPIALAAEALRSGSIVAVKGLGGIHLACLAGCEDVVRKLRSRKLRDEKPFAVMFPNLDSVRAYCRITDAEAQLLSGHIRPIVLLKKKERAAFAHLSDNAYLGAMLPYTPVHHLLMQETGVPLVMTSANISDLPILIDNTEAVNKLRGVADGFLLNNRDIENRCDDSLLRAIGNDVYFLRRSRGYAPLPLRMEGSGVCVLACGAEQKASFSLSRGSQIFQSAHIGDLKNAETLAHYESQIALFERLFDSKPAVIACDLHPDYLSTDYAQRRAGKDGLRLINIQHHHAHMASCMADNELSGQCIGIIWDGTGYGTDGAIWGGEFFTGTYCGFERRASIRPVRLPGGDRAVKEIHRAGISLMLDAGEKPEEFFPEDESRKIRSLLDADINCPLSSGMGRLFDGVSAIAGICQSAGYEGQGAVLLEAAADEDCSSAYNFNLYSENEVLRFDYRPMIRQICLDRRNGAGSGKIAAKFMNTLAEAALQICRRLRSKYNLNRTVLSGGVFQNMYLLERLTSALERDGFEVYRHRRVSANDEGISFGQMAIVQKGGGADVPCGTAENC